MLKHESRFFLSTYNYHELTINLFNHDLFTIIDVHSLRGGLAVKLHAIDGVPRASRIRVIREIRGHYIRCLIPVGHAEWSNEAVARDCGFTDRSYFQRKFKELTGQTPAEWRTASMADTNL